LVHEIINMKLYTTRKLINTNGNTEKIFQSINFREILPTEIFPWYIPRKLQWGKKLKQSKKKNDDVSFLPTELSRRYFQESSRTVHFPIALLIVVL
jgi:hypothetical protein